jgi:hypothetical protein
MLTVEIPGYGRLVLEHLVKRKAQLAEIVEAIRAVSKGKAILSLGVAGCILDEVIQEWRHIYWGRSTIRRSNLSGKPTARADS